MMRFVPTIAIPILVGLPVSMQASLEVAFTATVAGVVCAVGVSRSSLAAATTGAVIALIAVTLAQWESPSSIGAASATVFGLAILFLVEGTYFTHRYRKALVARIVWRRHGIWWAARAAVALGASLLVAALASALAPLLPAFPALFLAGSGVLLVFAAALPFGRKSEN